MNNKKDNDNKVLKDNSTENASKFRNSTFIRKIDKFFKITEKNSKIRTEIFAGLVTFLAMAYILVVNPGMISQTGMPYGAIFLATALASFIGTLIMGLFANLPLGLAPGMGMNAFFTFTVVFNMGFTWQEALGVGLLAGIIFLVISVTPLRKMIINAIPKSLKLAVGAGIGLFIAFVGLKNSGIIIADPATTVALGNLGSPVVILSLIGIVLSLVLYARKVKFNFIISILSVAVVGLIINYIYKSASTTHQFIAGFPQLGKFDYSALGSFKDVVGQGVVSIFTKSFWKIGIISALVTFVFVDMFDTLGTFMGVAGPAGLINEKGEMENAGKGLVTDSIATVTGCVLGTPVVTTYIESSAGIESGGRTGLTAVTVSFLFLLSIVLFPIFTIFSSPAVTTMVLFTVGIMMMTQLKDIEFDDLAVSAATFTILIMMILTFSIANGIAFGFIVYVIVKMAQLKFKEVHPMMYGLSAFFVLYFILNIVLPKV